MKSLYYSGRLLRGLSAFTLATFMPSAIGIWNFIPDPTVATAETISLPPTEQHDLTPLAQPPFVEPEPVRLSLDEQSSLELRHAIERRGMTVLGKDTLARSMSLEQPAILARLLAHEPAGTNHGAPWKERLKLAQANPGDASAGVPAGEANTALALLDAASEQHANGQRADAVLSFLDVMERYPRSAAAVEAQTRLEETRAAWLELSAEQYEAEGLALANRFPAYDSIEAQDAVRWMLVYYSQFEEARGAAS